MVGIIIRQGPYVVSVTAETIEEAEHIALELFDTVGLDMEGEKVTMMVYDPTTRGGIILDMGEEPPPSMEGWGPDGFTG